MIYDIGDKTRLSVTFLNIAGAVADPTTVTLKLRTPAPASVESSHVYGVDIAVVRESTGIYHYDLSLPTSGVWWYRWDATGAVEAADEQFLTVRASRFVSP